MVLILSERTFRHVCKHHDIATGTSGHTYTVHALCGGVVVCVALCACVRVMRNIFDIAFSSPFSRGRFLFRAQPPSPPYGGGGASRRGLRLALFRAAD